MGLSAPAGGGAPGDQRLIVTLGGGTIAECRRSWPFLGTGRRPVYYGPQRPVMPGGPPPPGSGTGGATPAGPGWADLPAALARVHLDTAVGEPVRFSVATDGYPPDAPPLLELLGAAGFVVTGRPRRQCDRAEIDASRERTLPDFVGGGMRMLVCGLNPSLVAADAGYGFAGATNRFWPAAVEAGIVTAPGRPLECLADDGVGMTDLVKRATPNADSLTAADYRAGAERLRRLVEWLGPGVVVSIGLAGWRAAVDRRATPGPQPSPFGGVPAYVMPSTSGRNARTGRAELVGHLRAAAAMAG